VIVEFNPATVEIDSPAFPLEDRMLEALAGYTG
jgi:hypothetical protein